MLLLQLKIYIKQQIQFTLVLVGGGGGGFLAALAAFFRSFAALIIKLRLINDINNIYLM